MSQTAPRLGLYPCGVLSAVERLKRVLLGGVLGVVASCHGGGDVGHHGDLVGGACGHDRDCVERCEKGGKFPDGTCTVRCDDDSQCPDGTACIDEAGGVCLLRCGGDSDCRSRYRCKDKKREGHGGKRDVCID